MAITITNLETVLNTKIAAATTATPGNDLLLISKSVEALDNAIGLKAADIGVNVQAYDATIMVDGDIGTTVQAFDAQLTDVAALTPTDGNFIVGDGTNFVAESAGTARTSLGLGTASTLNVGTALNEIVQLDGTAKLPAVDGSNLTGVDSLPAQSSQSGKFLTTDGSAASWGAVGGGLSMADQWRLTSNFTFTISNHHITANLERVDDPYFGSIGTGMTESSGVFTFPTTGYYEVSAMFRIRRYATISGTGRGGSISVNGDHDYPSQYDGPMLTTSSYKILVKVTDITTTEITFHVGSYSATCYGDTNVNETWFTFIKLGDI